MFNTRFFSTAFLLPLLALTLLAAARAADLPVREVILYKHGVGYFERSGELKAGETARLDFKAEDMNDVLKSLTLTDRGGGKIGSVRYDASEPLEKRLEDFPFAVGEELSLAAFLDQMKGARIELKVGAETLVGAVVSARLIKAADKDKSSEREIAMLMMDSGELRTFDLASAATVKFSDPKLQGLLKDYLAVLGQAHSKDRRSIYIDSPGSGAHELFARYMTPAAVWKSSYRLLFGDKEPGQTEPTLEGWAIVDNTTGEDWTNVRLSVVSGKPISFITQLYEPRYVIRPNAELAENRAVGPQVFEGSVGSLTGAPQVAAQMGLVDRVDSFAGTDNKRLAMSARPAPPPSGGGGGFGGGTYRVGGGVSTDGQVARDSTISTAEGRDAGELFEYSFSGPVTVKKGESAMLPFLQQKLKTRKLLIYSESFGLHPMDAAEITNTTGKTLDGGPITVYDAGSYAGEALVETVKAGDKRLISYGVDLGTRVTTKFNSDTAVVREVHFRRGILTAKSAAEETKTYTIRNVDGRAKTLIVEHPQRQGFKLLSQAPVETTSNAYRFEVKLASAAAETFPVREERLFDQTISVSNMTPDVIATWIQNKALSENGRRQLEQIAAKKREISANDAALLRATGDLSELEQDQRRTRDNIQSLNNVSGQQELVQQYARQLSQIETKMAGLRDTQSRLRAAKTQLDAELGSLMERTDF
jgi:hypothetical protein